MTWQSSTINPTSTTPADDIGKIKNDLQQLRTVIGGGTDGDIPVSVPASSVSFSAGVSGSAAARTAEQRGRETLSLADFTGADASGAANSDAAMVNFLAAIAGKKGVIPAGTWKLSGGSTYRVPDGTELEWLGANAVLKYTGTGACLFVQSSKNVKFKRPQIDLSAAGSAAIGIDIRGAWFVDIESPRIVGGNVGQTGINIVSSDPTSLGWGAYCINVFNPNFTGGPMGYGIKSSKQSGDSVRCTHLRVVGGYTSSCQYGAYLRAMDTFSIVDFTPENGVDGINLDDCTSGFLQLGELSGNSGYGMNFASANLAAISVVLTSQAGPGGTAGMMNLTYYTPALFLTNRVRLYGSSSAQDYWFEQQSQYSYGESMAETARGGGAAKKIRTFGDAVGQQLMYTGGISATSTKANNLRGSVTVSGTATTGTVTFPTAEPDATYFLQVTPAAPTGTPAAGSNRVKSISKAAGSFTITLEVAPGASMGQTFDWVLIR
jgi:hypothetical protein